MAGQTGRSLQLTTEQQVSANIALSKFGSKRDLAAYLKMSPTTITNFFAGRPVQRKQFHAICKKLKLDWQPESPKQASSNISDIDELVREVRSHCCSKILTTCNHIQLYTLKKIDLDQLFVPVFVSQEQNRQRESSDNNPPPLSALKTVNNHQHLIIFGKPGAGKSTFSSHLATTCCKEDSQPDWIPVLLRLRDLDTRTQFKLLELLRVTFDRDQSITEQILKSGKVFLILDGLDEISSQVRQEICQEITNLITDYHANKIVITCRSEFKDYKLSSVFECVEISDFDEPQQNLFIENWFSIANNDSASWLAAKLQQHLECNSQTLINHLLSNDRLRELAKTPILLSLICLVYVSDGVLQKKRSLLYERGLDILLEQWDDNRHVENRVESAAYKTLSSDDKQKILSELARYKFEQTEDVFAFEQAEALKVIAQYRNLSHQESLQILEGIAADHGLLFQSARKKWEFSHLTFQEYFVAQWFVQHQDWQKLAHNLFNPRWREVFLLTTEMSQSADDLLCLMKPQIDELMVGDEKLQQFLVWVDEKARSVNIFYKPAAIRAYYFAIYLSRTLSRAIYLSRTPFLDLDLYLALDHNLYLTLHFDQVLLLDRKLDLLLDLLLDLDILLDHQLYIDLDSALKVASRSDPELKLKLDILSSQLPNSKDAWELNKQWWQENGQAWTNQLHALIIKHRNIGHDWQFSDAQKEQLHQYYYANKLLVDCLNSDCYISRSVREEIEATLLLPIAEIKQRQTLEKQ
ncbi:MAG: NACHT domain-containing protein [Potamolinea sp.]